MQRQVRFAEQDVRARADPARHAFVGHLGDEVPFVDAEARRFQLVQDLIRDDDIVVRMDPVNVDGLVVQVTLEKNI